MIENNKIIFYLKRINKIFDKSIKNKKIKS